MTQLFAGGRCFSTCHLQVVLANSVRIPFCCLPPSLRLDWLFCCRVFAESDCWLTLDPRSCLRTAYLRTLHTAYVHHHLCVPVCVCFLFRLVCLSLLFFAHVLLVCVSDGWQCLKPEVGPVSPVTACDPLFLFFVLSLCSIFSVCSSLLSSSALSLSLSVCSGLSILFSFYAYLSISSLHSQQAANVPEAH